MVRVQLVLATLIILSGTYSYLNPDSMNKIIYGGDVNESDSSLVPLQDNEEWLVLKVNFLGNDFDSNKITKIFDGEYTAQSYINSLNPNSILNITIIDAICESSQRESYWGADTDAGRDESFESNIQDLVSECSMNLISNIDLSKWDLNDDGIVDRLLLIHSGQPQESSGNSNSIWSHFSGLDEPVILSEWSIEHYTIISLESGLGTLMHEMLHQMGAVDLYDVHSDSPTSNWNGLGVWDIMAGGNWNGDGNIPSLPSATSLELIGVSRHLELTPEDGQLIIVEPLGNGGSTFYIDISPTEKIRISLRSLGFDTSLPGSGILIEHQDYNNGNLDYNLVNTDPDFAWVKIIEADGNDGLLRGRNTGEAGDLFIQGDTFGNDGQLIRDNHGRLVQWNGTITNITFNDNDQIVSASIAFASSANENIDILTPRNPIQLLAGENANVIIHSNISCTLISKFYYNGIYLEKEYDINPGIQEYSIFNYSISNNKMGQIRGTIGCIGDFPLNINLDWIKIGHRILENEIEKIIQWKEDSTIYITPDYIGNESREYTISVSGAISRIAISATQGILNSGDSIILEITPNGLLDQGMVAKGEIILIDNNKIEQRIPLSLQSESPFIGEGLLPWMAQPSNGMFMISILIGLSLLTSKRESND